MGEEHPASSIWSQELLSLADVLNVDVPAVLKFPRGLDASQIASGDPAGVSANNKLDMLLDMSNLRESLPYSATKESTLISENGGSGDGSFEGKNPPHPSESRVDSVVDSLPDKVGLVGTSVKEQTN